MEVDVKCVDADVVEEEGFFFRCLGELCFTSESQLDQRDAKLQLGATGSQNTLAVSASHGITFLADPAGDASSLLNSWIANSLRMMRAILKRLGVLQLVGVLVAKTADLVARLVPRGEEEGYVQDRSLPNQCALLLSARATSSTSDCHQGQQATRASLCFAAS
jgi:hypothetical protein